MEVGGQHQAPAALTLGKTRYPLYRRLGRPQGRSGLVRKISPPPPPEFDPRTIQPVASRYTDCAIAAHTVAGDIDKIHCNLNCLIRGLFARHLTLPGVTERNREEQNMLLLDIVNCN